MVHAKKSSQRMGVSRHVRPLGPSRDIWGSYGDYGESHWGECGKSSSFPGIHAKADAGVAGIPQERKLLQPP